MDDFRESARSTTVYGSKECLHLLGYCLAINNQSGTLFLNKDMSLTKKLQLMKLCFVFIVFWAVDNHFSRIMTLAHVQLPHHVLTNTYIY